MGSIESTFKKVEGVISWYGVNSASAPINSIQDQCDLLAGYSYFIGEEFAKADEQAGKDEADRKFLFAQFIIEDGGPVAKAELKARIKHNNQVQKEVSSKAYSRFLKVRLDQINRLLQTMQQRISNLKREI